MCVDSSNLRQVQTDKIFQHYANLRRLSLYLEHISWYKIENAKQQLLELVRVFITRIFEI